jgi:hypothetical protein
MPPQSEWSWLEAYGLLEADPDKVHGADWQTAQTVVEDALEALIPEMVLQDVDRWSTSIADYAPQHLLQEGSGWGVLARHERTKQGETPLMTPGLPFSDASLKPAQAPWLELLAKGTFPVTSPEEPPTNFVVGTCWRKRLERAVVAGRADNWIGWYHLGVMRAYDGEVAAARTAWEQSLSHEVTPWALRNLAWLAAEKGDLDEAAACYRQALRLAPGLHPLAVEAGRFFVDSGLAAEWLDLMPELATALHRTGRLRLFEASAALACGETETAARFFSDAPDVADLREGELVLENLWFEWKAQELAREEGLPIEAARRRVQQECPVPPDFDFNMFHSPDERE